MTNRKISYILFGLSLFIIALIQIWAYRNAHELLISSERLSHAHEVVNQLTRITLIVADSQAGRRGYALTNDEKFLTPYYFAVQHLETEFKKLEEMTSDNPKQQMNCQTLRPLLMAELDRQKYLIELQKQQRPSKDAQNELTGKGGTLRDEIRNVLDNMKNEEVRLLQIRNQDTLSHSRQATSAMVTGTILSFVLFIVGFYLLNKEAARRIQVESRLDSSSQRFRALASHLQTVREEERAKIAREIHDELGQVMTALKIDLALLNKRMLDSSSVISRTELSTEINNMQKVVDTTIQSVRRMVTDLRPEILDLGLQAAIDWHAQQFTLRTKIPVQIKSNLNGTEIKNSEQSVALFRIFQETLTNVARHAKASQVEVEFDQDHSEIVLRVKDNGRGITDTDLTKANSFGILGLKERAYLLGGEVQIEGQPGIGTTVIVRVPKSALNL